MSARIDPVVGKVLDRSSRANDSDDEDALIAALEEDSDDGLGADGLSHLREKRLEQLHQELNRARFLRESQHGTYTEIKDEKEVLDITTSTTSKRSVVHFMKPDFNRCRIMDQKLAALAEKHYEVRFVSVNVENAPFLVVKLGIQVLPCVIAFMDGVSVERIVGFEGIGRKADSFTASELEGRLLRSGILVRAKVDGAGGINSERRQTQKSEKRNVQDDNEDDWD